MPQNTLNSIIIAETAFNHEGDKNYLLQLIDEISNTGISHIKFQVLIDCDEFVSELSAAYKISKTWCFSEAEWEEIFARVEHHGLRLFLMPLDTKAVTLCERSTVDFVEIHSVSFNDFVLRERVKQKIGNRKLVFGLGGRTLEEIELLKKDYAEKQLVLMHGFQAFPSKLDDVKLARLKYLMESFPGSSLGYADHSAPDTNDAVYSSIYAYHLGARIFEKHVTLETERTDSQSAFTAEQLSRYVNEMNRFESIVNEDKANAFSFTDNEKNYRNRQKQVVAIKEIKQGECFDESNLALKMHTEQGLFTRLDEVIGEIATQDYPIGAVLVNER